MGRTTVKKKVKDDFNERLSAFKEQSETYWKTCIEDGIKGLLENLDGNVHLAHVKDTPKRVVKAYQEYFEGCKVDPKSVLTTMFVDQDYDEMVEVLDIEFVSYCEHHLVPFLGKVHFAYLPKKKIVGLSKIPRLIDVLAHRPQVQERLSVEIVDTFQEVVQPKGCGVVIEAFHLCMIARGVRKERAYTKTTALRGCFKKSDVKSEFLNSLPKNSPIWG